jgi:hypothetical protein
MLKFILVFWLAFYGLSAAYAQTRSLHAGFREPPNTAKPGVYWYFMDGNLSHESMTKDLESMHQAGIGNLVFLEVNVGVPRGPVEFLSDKWLELFAHAVKEAERLGIEITLGIGPGWTGSGGPWVKPSESMQHLVNSTVEIKGGGKITIRLPLPPPRAPFFGEGVFTPYLKDMWKTYYEDVAVLAFPSPLEKDTIPDIDEKALVYRAPYSSMPGVKANLLHLEEKKGTKKNAFIEKNRILDLSAQMEKDGTLRWTAPPGDWTIMRFVRRNNGAITRPSPVPGLGFEADKFDTVAMKSHLDHYIGKILAKLGDRAKSAMGGLKMLHMDSWEMGAQNWTAQFRQEFKRRRGYDPLPYYPVYTGLIVQNIALSERFLWDLRLTAQELILENHARFVKRYGQASGLGLSIEPYDMNPTADLELGAVADVPMSEFWSKGYGFNAAFSVIEATSIAHVKGASLVPAEAFTAQNDESWKQYPGSMKNQGDWAFAAGINRFVFHTFQNQYLPDSLRPGMTMGPYGVHWDRNQTWWPMVNDYHTYLTRCQFLLQQGNTVADILYLSPEGSPHVFRAPSSAMISGDTLPDRRGYNFDACAPSQLYQAKVSNGRVVFPGGASYRLLVLPVLETMTPALLEKIGKLVEDGATIIGVPPQASPSLMNFPTCDQEVKAMATKIWGTLQVPEVQTQHRYGKGVLVFGGDLTAELDQLYPNYTHTAHLLKTMEVEQDFHSAGPIRYTHRKHPQWDLYFVSNRTDSLIQTDGIFRSNRGKPQLWDPITGNMRSLPVYLVKDSLTTIPLLFEAFQSYFIVFTDDESENIERPYQTNFPTYEPVFTLDGPWQVSFDPKWGGPADTTFSELTDWSSAKQGGVKYYSGIARYRKYFDKPKGVNKNDKLLMDIGAVHCLARVRINGKESTVLWTAPWTVDLRNVDLKDKGNLLEIEVANLWPNRLIGDEQYSFDGVKNGKWPNWLLRGEARPSNRYTFTTHQPYKADHPLFKSGLLGPVVINKVKD